jgi:hypothetical protein
MFVYAFLEGAIDNTRLTSISKRQAVFVGKAFSATLALVWFVFAFILSVAIGIAAASAKRDLAFGLNLGFCILAVFGLIQMILGWQIRSEL